MVIIILSVAVVVTGKLHWNNKIQATVNNAQVNGASELESTKATKEKTEDKRKLEEVERYSKNLPNELKYKLTSAVQDGNPLSFIIAGSDATANEPNAWPMMLKEELEDTYGSDVLQVEIIEIADKTSTQVVEEELYREIIDLSPDILLFEPFIRYDNWNVVPFEKRLENITQILSAIKNETPNVTILLQPANPLHKATRYPNEVNKLEEYAKENEYIYINHWSAWPDHQSDAIADYLSEAAPNEKGNEVWAEYLSNYFISDGN